MAGPDLARYLSYSPYISVISRRSRAATIGASRSILFFDCFLLMVRIGFRQRALHRLPTSPNRASIAGGRSVFHRGHSIRGGARRILVGP